MMRFISIILAGILSLSGSLFADPVSLNKYLPEVIEDYKDLAKSDASADEKQEWDDDQDNHRKEKRILIFETTDLHGYLFDASSGKQESFQYRLAYIANEINKARASDEYDDVILLDGGDIYQGTPFSSLTGGAPMRLALETMEYDAVALGNHEFDWDVREYCADDEGTLPPYEIGDYFGDPDIPVLACNLYDAKTMERVPFTQDYMIVERSGVKTAVIGYIPDYSFTILQEKIEPYYIDDDLEKLKLLVETVNEEEQPDATIILTHGDPGPVAEAMDPDFADLVLGGHTHEINIGSAENGIPFMQGNCYGQGYATAVLVIDGVGEEGADGPEGDVTVEVETGYINAETASENVIDGGLTGDISDEGKTGSAGNEGMAENAGEESLIRNVNIENIQYTSITEDTSLLYDTEENREWLDPEIMDISHAAWDAIQEEMGEVLGYVATSITRKQRGDSPSTVIGNWFTDLELRATEKYGTVAAFYNSGGIRAQFKLQGNDKKRNITVYDIYSMAPFGNSLLIYDITGPELAQQIVDGMRDSDYGDQLSGLTFTYTVNEERKPEILSITLDDGTEVDLSDQDTLYRVCISEYSATYPGSVLEDKEPVIPASDSPIDNESFIEVLRKEAAEKGGFLYIDIRPRGTKVTETQEEPEPAA